MSVWDRSRNTQDETILHAKVDLAPTPFHNLTWAKRIS